MPETLAEPFEAIPVEDDSIGIGHWLSSLLAHGTEAFALIALGSGGAAGMSRALLHGANNCIVVGEGTEHLVQRTIARASSQIQRRHGSVLRLGPYTLNTLQPTLSSTVSQVSVFPRPISKPYLPGALSDPVAWSTPSCNRRSAEPLLESIDLVVPSQRSNPTTRCL
jgi:hypothetical protein